MTRHTPVLLFVAAVLSVLDYRYGDVGKGIELVNNGYVQVGSITVVKGGDALDDAMKERVGPKACDLGGEIVMLGTSSPGSFTTNFSYATLMVFRRAVAAAGQPSASPVAGSAR